ncbi:hypothetical protein NEAUS03_0273 [Nematocida ausubeli]|nr:hypothetical protein NEAUS03_0273 [Nematocida ausubeli]
MLTEEDLDDLIKGLRSDKEVIVPTITAKDIKKTLELIEENHLEWEVMTNPTRYADKQILRFWNKIMKEAKCEEEKIWCVVKAKLLEKFDKKNK